LRSLSVVLCCAGFVGVVASAGVLVSSWYEQWAWTQSEEHRQAEQHLAAASARWAEPDDDGQPDHPATDAESAEPADVPGLSAGPSGTPVSTGARRRSPVTGRTDGTATSPPLRVIVPTSPTSAAAQPDTPSDGPSAEQSPAHVAATLHLDAAPAPHVTARLVVMLADRPSAPGQPVTVSIPSDWFDGLDIIGAAPAVLADREGDDGWRQFDFPAPDPGPDAALEIHVSMSSEHIEAPAVRVVLADGAVLAEQVAAFEGPPPVPGPVRALGVPRLGIQTGVVQTGWEPPSFVAGQITTSAPLGGGNSIIIGHRRGHAGDVFAPLVGVRLGDHVVAASDGDERRYIVSEIRTLPGSDITPMEPSATPRVTLMTCVGAWNPLTGDFSHRLWVVAEPPDQARATLSATVARASHTAETAASPADALRARTEALIARAALRVMDAEARRRPS